jgi:V/A-type H+-transporting ATPase subunit E
MDDKLQQLTDRLYEEGIVRAQQEADALLARARAEADALLHDARQEATRLREAAQRESQEQRQRTEAELRLAMQQSLNGLRQQIRAVVTARLVEAPVREALRVDAHSVDFFRALIAEAVSRWNAAQPDAPTPEVVLSEQARAMLEDQLRAHLAALLDEGLVLRFDDRLRGGFRIGPAEGGYQVSFSDDDFAAFFSDYLRRPLAEWLFGAGA